MDREAVGPEERLENHGCDESHTPIPLSDTEQLDEFTSRGLCCDVTVTGVEDKQAAVTAACHRCPGEEAVFFIGWILTKPDMRRRNVHKSLPEYPRTICREGGWCGGADLCCHVSSHSSDAPRPPPPQLAQQQHYLHQRDAFRLKHTNRASDSGKLRPPRPTEMYTKTNELIPEVRGQVGSGGPEGKEVSYSS